MSNAIKAVEVSGNSKLGKVSATYAAQTTCPSTCPLKNSGCYAENGLMGMHTRKLNASQDAKTLSVDELAFEEAIAIAKLTGNLPLRIHVVGDATTDVSAKLLSNAAEYYSNKAGQKVWSYTHAWKQVNRKAWGNVSIFASCESTKDAKDAMSKGYAAAIVVTAHESDKAYTQDGIKLIPCPQQTGRAKDCVSCGLCMRASSMLAGNAVIAFAVHGTGTKKATAKLVQIGGIQ